MTREGGFQCVAFLIAFRFDGAKSFIQEFRGLSMAGTIASLVSGNFQCHGARERVSRRAKSRSKPNGVRHSHCLNLSEVMDRP